MPQWTACFSRTLTREQWFGLNCHTLRDSIPRSPLSSYNSSLFLTHLTWPDHSQNTTGTRSSAVMKPPVGAFHSSVTITDGVKPWCLRHLERSGYLREAETKVWIWWKEKGTWRAGEQIKIGSIMQRERKLSLAMQVTGGPTWPGLPGTSPVLKLKISHSGNTLIPGPIGRVTDTCGL